MALFKLSLYGNVTYARNTRGIPWPWQSAWKRESLLRTRKLLQEAATAKGLTLTAFVTSSAREAALTVLREQHVVELSRRDQRALVQAILAPEAPNQRLRALAGQPGFRRR
jgi:uncharacterized protein (DUF1778 family)